MAKLITVPFGWLLSFLYDLTNNYGVALIIFATLVQLILLPVLVMALIKSRVIANPYAKGN